MGNNHSVGRPKGSKNKKKYPVNNHKVQERLKNYPVPNWKNKTHSAETKIKMSKSAYERMERVGLPRQSYKGLFRPKNPQKYKGDPTNIIYRSGWEAKFMKFLDEHPDVIEWSSEEIAIPYLSPIDGKWHRYFPDMIVKRKSVSGNIETIMVEIKPKKQTQPPVKQKRITKKYIMEVQTWGINSSKWQAAEQYCKARNWKFMKLTEDELNIR